MGMTYTYSTGKIERDFVLKKVEGNCNVDPEHTKLIGVMCKGCPHFLKMKTFYYNAREEYQLGLDKIGTFVFCKYHKQDDESAKEAVRRLYEDFREEAITHYYD